MERKEQERCVREGREYAPARTSRSWSETPWSSVQVV